MTEHTETTGHMEAAGQLAAAHAAQLMVFRHALDTIADEMHATLVRTAMSTNIKDRQDTSSAIYDATGLVVTQSEVATPVHLGTTHAVVTELLKEFDLRELKPGDAIVTNTPYPAGPGHLNDVAVVSPAFWRGELVAIVANQAHHVDMGGYAPGSMPFGVWEIYQEGLQIPPVIAFHDHRLVEPIWRLIAANIRNPAEVRGDLEAQHAANMLAVARIEELIGRHGQAGMQSAFAELRGYAERVVRRSIGSLPDGTYRFRDVIEGDGLEDRDFELSVAVTIEGTDITFDFTDSADAARGPINCGLASVLACVYYVVKAITDPQVPANAGAFAPVHVVVRPGSILGPEYPAAVCNANIVTTQRIVDVCLGALAQAMPDVIGAASSGTMHLLNLGMRGPRGYQTLVETFAGGQGALPGHDGISAVHCHMTNTRNTPVEIIEATYPITVEEYALADGSGGDGTWRGGLGIRRRYRLHAPATMTVSSDRTRHPPWGLDGGSPGGLAQTRVRHGAGEIETLPSKITRLLSAGDVIELRTPGGGGYGPAGGADPGRPELGVGSLPDSGDDA